jgi:hypothetical protein
MARRFIHDVSFNLEIDPTAWHSYQLDLRGGGVRYSLDGHDIFQTALAPAGPLGLVIWIDNQYAAFPPNGRLGYGLEVNPQPAWLEVGDLLVESSP